MSDALDKAADDLARSVLEAAAQAFEDMAREELDGESALLSYRQVISALRSAMKDRE